MFANGSTLLTMNGKPYGICQSFARAQNTMLGPDQKEVGPICSRRPFGGRDRDSAAKSKIWAEIGTWDGPLRPSLNSGLRGPGFLPLRLSAYFNNFARGENPSGTDSFSANWVPK